MRLLVTTEISLREPDVDGGLVTWFTIDVIRKGDGESEKIGSARAARVHLGVALNGRESAYEVLDADSSELERLYSVYFDGRTESLSDEYSDGAGTDVMYVDFVSLLRGYEGKNIELAVVRRLADTLGEGCELVVVPYENDAEALRWKRMGFELSTPGQATGLLHLRCALRHPRVVAADDEVGFTIAAGSESEL